MHDCALKSHSSLGLLRLLTETRKTQTSFTSVNCHPSYRSLKKRVRKVMKPQPADFPRSAASSRLIAHVLRLTPWRHLSVERLGVHDEFITELRILANCPDTVQSNLSGSSNYSKDHFVAVSIPSRSSSVSANRLCHTSAGVKQSGCIPRPLATLTTNAFCPVSGMLLNSPRVSSANFDGGTFFSLVPA